MTMHTIDAATLAVGDIYEDKREPGRRIRLTARHLTQPGWWHAEGAESFTTDDALAQQWRRVDPEVTP